MSEEDLAEFLTQPLIGVLATLRRDGMPYTVPVWWLWDPSDGGGFWISGTTTRVWCRQLRVDPRASLCVETSTPWPAHIGVDGLVSVHEPPGDDIWPITSRLAAKYVGRGEVANQPAVDAFLANMATEPRMLFRLAVGDRPNAMRAIDLRVYRGKRADREHQAQQREPRG